VPKLLRCPQCGTLCRQARGPSGTPPRLVPAALPLVARRLARLEAALGRVRRAVKAEALAKGCHRCGPPAGKARE
jgi:hypothetical protein